MFNTVLIANRGEIACRVIRTLRSLGIRSVAVYSDADADAKHVRLADVAVRLGGAAAADSYLNAGKIIAAALATGAEAIHPGYGFLSENSAFATACADAGIVFIGPSVEALEIMGDKISAKAQVSKRDVPIVPGLSEPGLTDEQLAAAAPGIGFPVLIKPSAGGGGKGMHLVHEQSELAGAIAAARREAASSFGDDTLFIERFVQHPRHIEVQVLADNEGNTVHLGERECSLQRRHQKVIEEAPSALLDEATRARIGQAAVDTAKSVAYRGAGTVEFIVSADAPDEFFFMEMNTRLQVEHPVTELVTGIDLVEWQLRIAAGESLDFGQDDVVLTGHAIEARVYAEDPPRGFLPTGGTVLSLVEPSGDGIRVDSALLDGLTVSSDYDPMLAKVIAWAPDRASAIQRLQAALDDTVTLGITNNVEFLKLLLAKPDVVAGRLDTELIERTLDTLAFRAPDFVAAAMILDALGTRPDAGPWARHDGWRVGAPAASVYRLRSGDETATVSLLAGDGTVELDGSTARVRIGDTSTRFRFARKDDRLSLAQDGAAWTITDLRFERAISAVAGANPELRSPMPGSVVAVFAEDGAPVQAGDPVLSIEAMKMEHVLKASGPGIVSLLVQLGDQVTGDQVVATIEGNTDE
ncbi:MAG: acetyl/propionyl/methylcrotonyl-CoA carboxylase subunit alpha [Microbacteriaceae bacterium]|nr:acetyl/propionyl/methylcrotonyl-CoA carboxylase subunit alpha [Microbacteriaceae bacterium]